MKNRKREIERERARERDREREGERGRETRRERERQREREREGVKERERQRERERETEREKDRQRERVRRRGRLQLWMSVCARIQQRKRCIRSKMTDKETTPGRAIYLVDSEIVRGRGIDKTEAASGIRQCPIEQ